MVSSHEFLVTISVLETLHENHGSNLRDLTNAYAQQFGVTKTSATAVVRMAIARGKSTGYVVEAPRGKYRLQGFGNEAEDCGDCEKGKAKGAKRKTKKGTGKGKGRAKGVAKRSKSIVKKKKNVKGVKKTTNSKK